MPKRISLDEERFSVFFTASADVVYRMNADWSEHRVIRADGSLGWMFSRVFPLFDERGEIMEWLGAASAVTERKLAEEALARLIAQSEQERRLYQTILANTPDLVTDARTWTYTNPWPRIHENPGAAA